MKAKASPPQANFAATKLHENEHEDSTTKMSKPDELQDDASKFDFTAIPLCGINDVESTSTLFSRWCGNDYDYRDHQGPSFGGERQDGEQG